MLEAEKVRARAYFRCLVELRAVLVLCALWRAVPQRCVPVVAGCCGLLLQDTVNDRSWGHRTRCEPRGEYAEFARPRGSGTSFGY